MTREEAEKFGRLWSDIRRFRIKDLPEGAQDMAHAMLTLTGRKLPRDTRRGRKRMVPLTPAEEAAEAERIHKENAAAMAAAIAKVVESRKSKAASRREEIKQMLADAAA